jgi:hypothetical protein
MTIEAITIGSQTYTVQNLRPMKDAIRWAVGNAGGIRSSTWRLWANKKGDVYLAQRSLGSQFKMSIHQSRYCSVGFTNEYEEEARARFGGESRHWEQWKLPDAPVVRAVEVVIPNSELALLQTSEADPMAWIAPPGFGRAAVFALFIAEPKEIISWEIIQRTGTLIGTIGTRTRAAWLTYTSQVLSEQRLRLIAEYRTRAVANAARHGVTQIADDMRLVLAGHGAAKADAFFVELNASTLTTSAD